MFETTFYSIADKIMKRGQHLLSIQSLYHKLASVPTSYGAAVTFWTSYKSKDQSFVEHEIYPFMRIYTGVAALFKPMWVNDI